jgi:hypothetical protein
VPLSDFRDTFAWREAIELGPDLLQLAEQLPASEERGLAYRIRQVMVELPAAIAYDLLESESYSRKLHIAELAAMLDIIDKVYPALDTVEPRNKLEQLAIRVGSSDTYGEQTPGAAKAYLPGAHVHSGPADPAPKPVEAQHEDVPAPDPGSVRVTPDDDTAHSAPAPVPTKVQITPDLAGDPTGDHAD